MKISSKCHRMLNVLINFHTNCIGQIKNLRSLTFAKNNIEKKVKERVLSKIIKNILNVRYIYGLSEFTRLL